MAQVGYADTSMIDWGNIKVDHTKLPKVAGYRILVKPFPIKEKTAGGLYITDNTQDQESLVTTVGIVMDIGALAYTREDMLVTEELVGDEHNPMGYTRQVVKPWCKVGEVVVYGKYAGKKIMWGGVPYVFLNDDEIIATYPQKS